MSKKGISKRAAKKARKSKSVIDKSPTVSNKTVRDTTSPPSYFKKKIRFSAEECEISDVFCWSGICAHTFLKKLYKKFKDWESMRYDELIGAKKKSHAISFDDPKLNKEAISILHDRGIIGRFDELISLRVQGAERVWCVHNENILYVVFWDPKHEIYPVTKK